MNYIKSLTFCFLCAISLGSVAQPDTLWTKTMGGPGNESILAFGEPVIGYVNMATNDAEDLFVVARINTPGGDITNIIGGEDVWVIKMKNTGDTIWTAVIGGTGGDYPSSIITLPDGGCVIGGWTYSNDLDFQGHHGSNLEADGFLVRLDSVGTLVWSKQYGGSNFAGVGAIDRIRSIALTHDNNLFITGATSSQNGDFAMDLTSSNNGWIMKVNINDGAIIQINKIGTGLGSASDFPVDDFTGGFELSDSSGYIVAGETILTIDLTPTIGVLSFSTWVCKIDYSFNKVWQKILTNSNNLDSTGGIVNPFIIEGKNNTIIYAAEIKWKSGNVTSPHYGNDLTKDYWMVVLDSIGNITKQNTFGGSKVDAIYSLEGSNGTYYVSGLTRSMDFYSNDTIGATDMWIVSFDDNLDTNWTYKLGGTAPDDITSIVPVNDSTLYIAGRTSSNDYYIHGNHGGKDVFIAKLSTYPINTSVKDLTKKQSQISIYPNPSNGVINVATNVATPFKIIITDIAGRIVYNAISTKKITTIDISSSSNGIYTIQINDLKNGNIYSKKIIK